MHKRGVALVLSLAITLNAAPLGAINSFAQELNQNEITLNSDAVSEKNEKATYEATRTMTANVKINNSQYGVVDGVSDGESVVLKSYFNNVSSTIIGTIKGDLANQDDDREIIITPKSGYNWSYDITNPLIFGCIKKEENKLTLTPITSTNWTKSTLNLSDSVEINFKAKSDAQKIEVEYNSEDGQVLPKEGHNLYFDEETKSALIDNGTTQDFVIYPAEGKKVGEVTLDGTPIAVKDNTVTVGAGKLVVTFVDDVKVKNYDLNVQVSEGGHIVLNNENVSGDAVVALEENKAYRFTTVADEGKYIDSVKLGDMVLTADEFGAYTIPSDFNGEGSLVVEFKDKIDTEIVFESLRVPYNGEGQKLYYTVKGLDGETIQENLQVKFEKKNFWGSMEEYDPKEEGFYEFTVNYEGNHKYNKVTVTDIFEIYDGREEATVKFESLTDVYNGENHDVKYTVVGNNGEVLDSGSVKFIKYIDLGSLGSVPVETNAKNAGTYEMQVEFEGDKNYKPLKLTEEYTITKCKPSITVGNNIEQYNGSGITVPVDVEHDLGYITLYTGVNFDLALDINIDINLGDDLIGKAIKALFESVGEINVGELKQLFADNKELLGSLGLNVDDLITALEFIPEDLMVKFGAPKNVGAYIATAIVLDQNADVAVGVGGLVIRRQEANVVFTNDSLDDKAIVKVGTDYNHKAVFENSDHETKLRYTGVTSSGEVYCSNDKPAKEGIYVVTAYSYDDPQFALGLAMRTFTISKVSAKVEMMNSSKTYDGMPFEPQIVVSDNYGETIENPDVTYTYYNGDEKLEESPKDAGMYKLVITFNGDKSHFKKTITKTFKIDKKYILVDIDDKVIVKGEEEPEFTYIVDGLIDGETVNFELVREAGDDFGDYKITVVEQELQNYGYLVRKGTLKITDVPVINVGDITINVGDKFNPYDYVNATDREDGDLTEDVAVIENTVDTSKYGTYNVVYRVRDSHKNVTYKEIKVMVNPFVSGMNAVPQIIAEDVVINLADKFNELDYATANDKEDGDLTESIVVENSNVNPNKVGDYEVTYSVTDKNGAKCTKTISVTVNNLFHTFIVNSINSSEQYITGKGEAGAKVTATVNGDVIGESIVNENGTYSIEIEKQSKKTEIVVTITKDGYTPSTKKINVIEVSVGSSKDLTNDIFRYDSGKGNYLAYINGKGYSQYSYLNKSGNYAFTPSSWMKAAGLTVSMPSLLNNYNMRVENSYIELFNDANALLNKIKENKLSSKDIEYALRTIEISEGKLDTVVGNDKIKTTSRSGLSKTLTKDIYRYDAGKGNHVTYVNNRGYSQYSYLNKSGNYAFVPSSWIKAAGVDVENPTKENGYVMRINNKYIEKYNKVIEEIKSYID